MTREELVQEFKSLLLEYFGENTDQESTDMTVAELMAVVDHVTEE
jgi:hypothetical protein